MTGSAADMAGHAAVAVPALRPRGRARGVAMPLGTFAMIHYCLGLFPSAAHYFTPLIAVLSVTGVLYAAVVTIGQAGLKR